MSIPIGNFCRDQCQEWYPGKESCCIERPVRDAQPTAFHFELDLDTLDACKHVVRKQIDETQSRSEHEKLKLLLKRLEGINVQV